MLISKTELTILMILFFKEINCAKILGIFMGLGNNHYVLGKFLMTSLVEAGHDCVLISRYCDERNNDLNYREIIIRDDENSGKLKSILYQFLEKKIITNSDTPRRDFFGAHLHPLPTLTPPLYSAGFPK